MKYDQETYRKAMQTLEWRRRDAEQTEAAHKREMIAASPRIAAIFKELAQTGPLSTRIFLSGKDVHVRMEELRHHNLALQAELRALIADMGKPADYLDVPYTCKLCRDTGYIDGKMCDCLKTELRRIVYEDLNSRAPLSLSTFDTFSLEYYPEKAEEGRPSPRALMERTLAYCRQYAASFGAHSPSMLFQGGTGLGKTHLSLAIANEVLKRGYGVIYGTAQNLATMLENERFSDEESGTQENLISCDLLILDDLGTEFSNHFVLSAFYNMINTRLLTQRPTIISTNLSLRELEDKYGSRIVSRIIGAYEVRVFSGNDVRQILRREKMNAARRGDLPRS